MSQAKTTREHILYKAAELFNQQGYGGVSISDIMRATNLQKGGIYNHFQSKEELALNALDLAFNLLRRGFINALKLKKYAIERLEAIIPVSLSFVIDGSVIPGGCPILNTAIECEDTNSALLLRTQEAMNSWRQLICQIIEKGIEKGELAENIEADEVATIIISNLEGVLMMSQLYKQTIHMERVSKHLYEYLKSLLPTKN
ncbi:MAG TPA: TetR/AcrR family transcriptional regulator [Leptolyngbyaceae cyanobacterium]